MISVAAAFFYHLNTFASYYSIETRAYSLWCSLTTLNVLFLLWAVYFGLRRWQWVGYATVCILLSFTTFASLGLVLGGFILQYFLLKDRKSLPRFIGLSAACMGISYWYLAKSPPFSHSPTWELCFHELREVISKSLHAHAPSVALLVFSLFCVLLPLLSLKKKEERAVYALVWGSLAYAGVLILSCMQHHYLVASRQYIFLVPYLSAAYALGLYQSIRWLVGLFNRLNLPRKLEPTHVLLVWSAAIIFTSVKNDCRIIRHDLVQFKERHSLSKSSAPICPRDFPDYQYTTFEKINDTCRSL